MKILHLNFYDIEGGAATAMYRLHTLLIKNDINSKVLVFSKKTNNSEIIETANIFEKFKNKFKRKLSFNLTKFQKIYSKSTHSLNIFNSGLLKNIKKINPDILHLHWINNEFISIKEISKIDIPIVWTFYDMWPFLGAEHYTHDTRFINGYNKSNKPKENTKLDLNKIIWQQKKKYWNNNQFKIVGLSNWLSKQISTSDLFKNNEIHTIPPPLDFVNWNKIDKKIAREKLGIHHNKKILLFGAANGVSDKRKGFDIILDILKNDFFKNKEIELILFGGKKYFTLENENISIKNFGHINFNDYKKLSLLYSAADLTLLPSKLEAFGQVGLESLSCGTPVISFRQTGPEDMIIHKKNGYLAEYLDREDFFNGVKWYLNLNSNQINQLNSYTRESVINIFDEKKIFNRYLEIYEKLK